MIFVCTGEQKFSKIISSVLHGMTGYGEILTTLHKYRWRHCVLCLESTLTERECERGYIWLEKNEHEATWHTCLFSIQKLQLNCLVLT